MHRTRLLGAASLALVVALLAGLWPASAVTPPSVATTSIGGYAVEDNRVKPLIRTSTFAATGVANAVQPLVVDAGNSAFVKVGDAASVSGLTTGGTAPYEVAWSYGGAADRFTSPTAANSSFSTTGLAPGAHVLTLTGTDANGATATDIVKIYLWRATAKSLLQVSGETGPGVPDEQDPTLGLVPQENSGVVDGQTYEHPFTVPVNTLSLRVRLDWGFHEEVPVNDPTGVVVPPEDGGEIVSANANDYDLYVDDPSDAEDDNATGATGSEPEIIDIEDPASGDWKARIASFLTPGDTYTLRVSSTERVANPLPSIETASPFRFDLGQQQLLTATPSGANAPLSTRWDTNLDGIFESAGTSVVTRFDEGTHLVSVKVTDAKGFEHRQVVGVRVVSPDEGPTPPVVVIGLADTGINVYHDDFGAELFPDARLLAATDNFTKHPSEYIDGFPAATSAINITKGAGYLPDQDKPLFTRENLPLEEMFWVPGTKIVGVFDGGDTWARDLIPVLDDEFVPDLAEGGLGHGTASASVAAGNIFGFCPTCLLVFSEDINGNTQWMFDEPWIDVVSSSYSPQSNLGSAGGIVPFFQFNGGQPKAAAERGQLALYAAGNGNENAFVTPEQTYTSDLSGPGWTIRIGAAERGSRKPIVGTGKPVDVTSWGSGNIPSASYKGTSVDNDTHQHGGTSAATPYTSGVFGSVLAAVRDAVGDTGSGQRGNGVIARGTAIPGSAYLADGELTHAELREVVFKTTEHDDGGNVAILPTTTPNTPAQFVVEGYGIAEPESAARAIDVLIGGAALPDRLPEDTFFTADRALRDTLWGEWSGGGENSSAASAEAAAAAGALVDPSVFLGVTEATLAGTGMGTALSLLDRAILAPHPTAVAAAATQAAGAGPTYYLHHLGGCVNAAVPGPFMDLANTTGDDDLCGSTGTAGLLNAEVESWTSTVAVTETLAETSAVDGILYLTTDAPAPTAVTLTLLAGSQAVGQQTVDVITLGLGDIFTQPDTGGTVPVHFSFELDKDVVPGQKLTLSVALDGTASQYFGYEDDHASFFTVTPAEGGGGGGGTLGVGITSPAEGAEIDPAATPQLAVGGTATFPAAAGPTTRYYPKWLEDGADGCAAPTVLITDASVVDSGCSNLAQGLSPLGVVEIRESYPLQGDALPIRLTSKLPVSGTMVYGSVAGAPVRVRVELVTTRTGLRVVLGSQVVEGIVLPTTQGLAPKTALPFSFSIPSAYDGVSLSSLSLETVWEQDVVSYTERDNPGSFVDLPLAGGTGGGRVEVSIDDATFASPVVATLGSDGTWGASFPTDSLAAGAHVLRARAVQGASVSAVASRSFTVKTGVAPVENGVQVQVTLKGAPTRAAGWQNAADTSAAGDLSSWVAQLTVKPKGSYELHTRLLLGGKEAARGLPIIFVRSAQQ